MSVSSDHLSHTPSTENPFFPPKADEQEDVKYTVVDIQTNGLIEESGISPDPLQVSWMHLSEDFSVLDHKTVLIRQDNLGPAEARRVHKIGADQLAKFGLGESDVCKMMSDATGDGQTLVFYNAEFDVQVLCRMMRKHLSVEAFEVFARKKTICVMRFEEHLLGQEYRYVKLPFLASSLTGISQKSLEDHPVTSWRNVCLTRLCFKVLCERHDLHYPPPESLTKTACYYLKSACE
ncbi:MAG: 3'-5' exonuclease [Porphyromonas sp.]|nr:3'-5' exonuclease [Porphyromonas sp.]